MTKDEALKLALEALELEDMACRYEKDPTPEHIAKAITALRQAIEQAEQEPVGEVLNERGEVDWISFVPPVGTPVYTHPAPPRKPLTEREVELLDGLIEVQLDHALRCDSIGNRTMAEKQKAWDMERVELLRKLKAAHGIKE